jgi:hypothetical protein
MVEQGVGGMGRLGPVVRAKPSWRRCRVGDVLAARAPLHRVGARAVAQQRDRLVAYRDAEIQRIVLNVWPGPDDPAMIKRFGGEVIAAVGQFPERAGP